MMRLRPSILWSLSLLALFAPRTGVSWSLPSSLRPLEQSVLLKSYKKACKSAVCIGLSLSLLHGGATMPPVSALTEDQALVDSVWKEVSKSFFDKSFNGLGEQGWREARAAAIKAAGETESREMTYDVIRMMLKKLGDPYTRFLAPEQLDAIATLASGYTAGVGVQLDADTSSSMVRIVALVPNGPAEKMGLKPGDVIIAVDQEPVTEDTAEVVASRLRGYPGSSVGVEIRRASTGLKEVIVLEREITKVASVKGKLVDLPDKRNVAVISIPGFSQETPGQLLEALRACVAVSKDNRVDAIVLDLRGNAGGYLPAGIQAADLFLPPGKIIVTEVNSDGNRKVYPSTGVGSNVQTPLFIVVDKRTASASEIMAAALKDNGRATIVGTSRTVGKGKIQNIKEVGSRTAISVTRAIYLTPKGLDINGKGLEPDILRSDSDCGAGAAPRSCVNGLI